MQRCSQCGSNLPLGLSICSSCGSNAPQNFGKKPGQRAAAVFDPLESGEIGFESPSDNSNIWNDDEQTDRTRAREIRAIARLQRALDLTGVSDVGRGLGRVFAHRVPNVVITNKNLSPFEAFIYSIIEGQQAVLEIMEASGLTLYEAVTALSALYEQGVIIVEEIPLDEHLEQALHVSEEAKIDHASSRADNTASAAGPVSLGRLGLQKKMQRVKKKPWVETDPDILFSMADQAFGLGEINRARDLVRQALVHAPNSERAKQLRERLQAPDQAFERAKILHGLGVQAYKDKDYNLSVRLIQASVEEYDLNPSAHHRLGLALVHQQNSYEAAEQHLRRALEMDPENPKYQRNLDRLLEISRRLRRQGIVG